MDGSVLQTWMSDILHVITQGLLVPDIILLIGFIVYALFCIGSILVEFFTERKHFKVAMPDFLADLMAAKEDEIPGVIERSGLLKRQKVALLTVYDYRVLPGDALIALIKRLVTEEESRYDRISGRNNMAARVSPMLGLMGTLIPLGPGIQALGSANTELLSASLLIAFDTTVAGLVVAAVCMVIGKIRSIWYSNYMSALDSAMATMLQKIEDMRAEGKIVTKEPSDYAFLFKQVGENKPAKEPTKRRKSDKDDKSAAADSAKTEAKDSLAASVPAVGPAPSMPAVEAAPAAEAAPAPVAAMPSAPAASVEPVMAAAPEPAPSVAPVSNAPYGAPAAGGAPTWEGAQTTPAQSDFAAQSVNPSLYGVGEVTAVPAGESAFGAGGFPVSSEGPAADQAPVAHQGDSAGFGGYAAPVFTQAPAFDAGNVPAPTFDPAFAGGTSADSLSSMAYEPVRTYSLDASFAPVPDPAFISDLAAASAANPEPAQLNNSDFIANLANAPVYAQPVANAVPAPASAPTPEPQVAGTLPTDLPFELTREQQASGWYQPRLRSEGASAQPYAPSEDGFAGSTGEPYQNR